MDAWMPMLYIVGGFVLLVGVIIVLVRVHKRRQAKAEALRSEQQDRLDTEWIAKVADLESDGLLHEAPEPPKTYRKKRSTAVLAWSEKIRVAQEAERQARIRALHRETIDTIMQTTNSEELRDKLLTYSRKNLLEYGPAEAEVLKQLTQEHANSLYQTVIEENDSATLVELVAFVTKRRYAHGSGTLPSKFEDGTGREYVTPLGWQDVIANLIENPVIGDFRLPQDPWPAGEYLLKAAEALRERSLTLAKIILAYAKSNPKYRAEIGNLAEELAKMVDAIHAERALFAQLETQTE